MSNIRMLKNAIKKNIWNLESFAIRIKYKSFGSELCLNDKHILIIAPHADDELIGCYSILKNTSNQVDLYYTGLTGSNNDPRNRDIRLLEIKKLADMLSIPLYYDSEHEEKVLLMLLQNSYDCVFLPTYIDWHPEHRSTCLKIMGLLDKNNCKCVYLYSVSVPIPPHFVTDYTRVNDQKWELFKKVYLSQHHMPVERYRALEAAYRNEKGLKYTDPFIRIECENICSTVEKMHRIDVNKLDSLRSYIDNPYMIVKHSNHLYKEAGF